MALSLQQRTKTSIAVALIVAGLVSACGSAPPSHDSHDAQVVRPHTGGTLGYKAAELALRQVGAPYQYGGRSPRGFDCSGLVQYAYLLAGKQLPRTTRQLWSDLPPVSTENIRVGDVLFFNVGGKMSHVGVYIGDERFVHAPSTGRKVSVASLESPYYGAALIRAGRPR
jgi:cell wall-associated NlpC family hydrolase